MVERNPHPHPTLPPIPTLSYPITGSALEDSHNMTSEPSLRKKKKNQETEEQKKRGRNSKRIKQDELPVKWVGRASTQSLRCNTGKKKAAEGL